MMNSDGVFIAIEDTYTTFYIFTQIIFLLLSYQQFSLVSRCSI